MKGLRAGLIGALVVGVMSVGAASAQAQAKSTYTCQIDGLAGVATPGVQNINDDRMDLDLLDSDDGSDLTRDGEYVFGDSDNDTAEATCVHVNNGGSGTTNTASVSIDSTGTYENQVCSTGNATGDPNNTTFTELAPGTVLGGPVTVANYSVDFAGGTGPIFATGVANASGETGDANGVIHITPSAGNCATTNVTEFDVDGAIEAVLD